MKILITGGVGFIGFHLAKHLAFQGHSVIIADNLFRGKMDEEVTDFLNKNPRAKYVYLNMEDRLSFQKLDDDYDQIYHLAAINGTRYFYEEPEMVLRVNLLSIINLLEWIKYTGCKDVFFSSSSETYAGTIQKFGWEIPTAEDVPLCIDDVHNPRYSYGGSKIVGELLFLNYARKYNLNVRIGRFHNIYGERMGYEHVIPEFCKRVLEKQDPFIINGGDETRSFIHVDDGVRASKLIMDSPETRNQIINIGSDSNEISIKELAEKLFKIAGVTPNIEVREAPKGSVARRCPNIAKLRGYTGYFESVSFDEGLKRTFEWYKKDLEDKK